MSSAPASAAEPLGLFRVALLITAAIWFVGACVQLLRLIAGAAYLSRLPRGAHEPSLQVRELFDCCRAELGLRRAVRLGVHPALAAPVFVGGWRACVLVTSDWERLAPESQRAVLWHELAHAARRDDFAKLAEETIRAVFFFHPLVYWLLNRIDAYREQVCDAAAVRRGVAGRALAQILVDFTRLSAAASHRDSALRPALPFFRRRTVKNRIRELLEETTVARWSAPLVRRQFIGVAVIAVAIGTALGGFGLHAAGPPTPRATDAGPKAPAATPARENGPVMTNEAVAPAHGRVVDAQGHPLKNVKVRLHEQNRDEFVSTDATGHFLVPQSWSKKPFEFSIIVRLENAAIGWYGSGYDRRRDQPIPRDFDVPVYPLSKTVRGKLLERDGKPAAGVRLKVETLGSKPNGFVYDRGSVPEPAVLGETVSDDRGEYSLRVPDETFCMLRVVHPRYTAQRLAIQDTAESEALGYATLSELGSVRRKDLKPGVIELTQAGRIEGRVVDGRTGQPLANASVGCQALAHDVATGGWGEGISGADGRYHIEGLGPGVYNVVFLSRANTYRTAVANDGVLVEPGRTARADLVVTVARRLTGRVVDADTDEPMAGIQIGYYGPAAPRSGAMCLSATTDKRGEFELFVPPGPSHVYVMNGDYRGPVGEANVSVPEGQGAAPILFRLSKVARRSTRTFAVDRAIPRRGEAVNPIPARTNRDDCVSGVIVDPSGKPISGARIFHTGDAPDDYITSDGKGEFVFRPMGRRVSFTLRVFHQGFHVWGGTPKSGDVLSIVLEPKATPTSPQ